MLKVHVLVHLRPDILDVQGQAIRQAVTAAGHAGVAAVRVGKSFYLDIDAPDAGAAREEVERLCKETLSNPLLEDYTWEVVPS
jgi:phosphoribosylformylglycinamidine synthase